MESISPTQRCYGPGSALSGHSPSSVTLAKSLLNHGGCSGDIKPSNNFQRTVPFPGKVS